MQILLPRERVWAGGQEEDELPGPGEEVTLPHPYPRVLWSFLSLLDLQDTKLNTLALDLVGRTDL